MSDQKIKRSNEPIFWGLFGAGGMWSAIFFPVLIVIVAFILPFVSIEYVLRIISVGESWLGRLFILFSIVLPLWCGLHRVHHALHDIKVHIPAERLVLYGIATILSLVAIYGVFTF